MDPINGVIPADTSKHPLLNDLILSNLVAYIPFNELRNVRRVSRAWNQATFPRLKKADLKITFEVLKSSSEVKKFNNIWKSSSTIPMPFSRFTFKGVNSISPAIEDFFECFGSSVKELLFSINLQATLDYTLLSNILFEQIPQNNRKIIVANTLIDFEMFEDQVKIEMSAGPDTVKSNRTKSITKIIKVLEELMLPNAKKLYISVTRVQQCCRDREIKLCSFVESFMRDLLLAVKTVEQFKLHEFVIHMKVHYKWDFWMSFNGFDLALKEFLVAQKEYLKKLVIFADVDLPFFSELQDYKFSKLDILEIVDYDNDKLLKVYNTLKA